MTRSCVHGLVRQAPAGDELVLVWTSSLSQLCLTLLGSLGDAVMQAHHPILRCCDVSVLNGHVS